MRRSLVMAANLATTAAVRPTVIFLHGSGDTGRGVEGWLRSLAPPDALDSVDPGPSLGLPQIRRLIRDHARGFAQVAEAVEPAAKKRRT